MAYDRLSTMILLAIAVILVLIWYPIFFVIYVIFIFSAIALSDVVMTLSIPILFISRNYFRKLTNYISFIGWPLITLAFETLGKNKIVFTGDDILAAQKTDRSALVTLNHTYYCDWLLAFSLGERVGKIGNIKIAMKDVIKYIPFVGVGIWAMGFIFLSRKWQDDQHKINKAYSHLRADGEPFWFVTHPEGSRMSTKNLEDSQRFAKERGAGKVPVLNNLLLPRLKGFVSSVIALRDCTDAVYDMTAAYKKRPAGFLALFYGSNPTEAHVHLRRFDMNSLPKSEEEIGAWLYKRYQEKDELLTHFKEKGYFPGQIRAMPFKASNYFINLVFWITSVLLFIYTSNQFYKQYIPI